MPPARLRVVRQATWHNFHNIHVNFTRVCDDACLQMQLPFDVPSLADLCRRGTIKQSYAKCNLLSGGGSAGTLLQQLP